MRKIVLTVAVVVGISLPSAAERAEGSEGIATARAAVPCIDCWR
ncbi:hypothetical protein GCM10009721_08640 [Terrabacter tumescens]|uniref:Uncharacterized protein n=1 Tax=Terrabacter tumescens TaxID=60443 RepID=A0ABQ2HQB6_9MICO|nr:hypothetical protein [Terrabacter tumescens]GGM86147.1 hypothetical protein GCM10009721_08640 [Terrabacter tumescens]